MRMAFVGLFNWGTTHSEARFGIRAETQFGEYVYFNRSSVGHFVAQVGSEGAGSPRTRLGKLSPPLPPGFPHPAHTVPLQLDACMGNPSVVLDWRPHDAMAPRPAIMGMGSEKTQSYSGGRAPQGEARGSGPSPPPSLPGTTSPQDPIIGEVFFSPEDPIIWEGRLELYLFYGAMKPRW